MNARAVIGTSEIEATHQIGAGTKFTDRAGRVWECKSYISPSGPAFWLTLPEEFWPAGTANYTVHFDGVMGVSQGDPAGPEGCCGIS